MSDIKIINGGVCAAKGFKASGVYCGVKAASNGILPDGNGDTVGHKNDIAMIFADVMCNTAGVFTSNKVKGAPVVVTKENLAVTKGRAQAVIVNSGNANTGTAKGIDAAREMCRLTGEALGIAPEEVVVASTGVIGLPMPIEPIKEAVPRLKAGLSYEGNEAAATAIMTTDTVKKEYAAEFEIDGKICRLGGMAKGSGMIHPNMATTLNFITTDCAVSVEMLQRALSDVVKVTYNCLSVDGDQSTNDTCVLMSSGLAGNGEITSENEGYKIFREALFEVMKNLTIMLAKDGEGATKLITCIVDRAPDWDTAVTVAKSVIRSPLVKTMIYGEDANCGRIICAAGYAEADIDINKLDIYLASRAGKIQTYKNGISIEFSEEKAAEILREDEIEIHICLGMGDAVATAWGCDLTYDYVKINGDYRS